MTGTARSAAFEAIGTRWDIHIADPLEPATWNRLLWQVRSRVATFDKAYSRFRDDSLVAAMSRKAGTYELPEDGYALLRFYERLYRATSGRVTPLAGQLLADAGYDAEYSFAAKPLQAPPEWEAVLTYDTHHITVRHPVLLDFGAAGKGYLVDIVANVLRQAGVQSYLVNAGGDMLHRSAAGEAVEVGLENPADSTEVIGVAQLSSRSLCASAGNKRAWRDFHHIIDPKSLQPVEDIVATWVIADDTMTADGLATALFFEAPEKLRRSFSFAYAVLGKGMRLSYAKDFPATVFEA